MTLMEREIRNKFEARILNGRIVSNSGSSVFVFVSCVVLRISCFWVLLTTVSTGFANEAIPALTDPIAQEHLRQYCSRCHGQTKTEGKMRLDQPLDEIDEESWQKIVQVLHHVDMPPKDERQPSKEVRSQLEAWAQGHLNQHILKRAGDPGAVAWRRLTAIELDNMIRDLTGHPMEASRHFPAENFGGEGFSNIGNVQNALSGPVLDKYLAMAEEVARHARFDQQGEMVFDPSGAIQAPEVRRDKALSDIKLMARQACGDLYLGPGKLIGGEGDERSLDGAFKNGAKAWGGPARYLECLWLAQAASNPQAALADIAKKQNVNVSYLRYLSQLRESCPPGTLESALWVEPLRRLPKPGAVDQPIPDDMRAACTGIANSIWSCMRLATANSLTQTPSEPYRNVGSSQLHIRLTRRMQKRRDNKNVNVMVAPERLTVVVDHVLGEGTGAIVYLGLPTLHLKEPDRDILENVNGKQVKKGRERGETREVTLDKNALVAMPAGARWSDHSFAKDKTLPALVMTKPAKLVFDIGKVSKQLNPDGGNLDAFMTADRTAQGGQVQIRHSGNGEVDEAALRWFTAADGNIASWLVAHKEQEEEFVAEWHAMFRRWFPPHPVTIAPFDGSRSTYGLPDEVQFYRDDSRLKAQLLDPAGQQRMNDLWADLYMLSNEPRQRLAIFAGKYQISSLDEAAQIAKLEEIQANSDKDERQSQQRMNHPYGEIPVALPARLKFYQEQMDQHRNLWRVRTLAAVTEFANQAWRRPLTERERARFERLYDSMPHVADTEIEGLLQTMLMRVLVSPHFLFRCERIASDGKEAPLDAWQLATRLSLMIWASLPDEELRRCAADGSLLRDDVLRNQTRRMLADPKARGMAEHFFGQWLGFSGFDRSKRGPDVEAFPEFTPQVRRSLHGEAVAFFEDLIRNDRDVRLMVSGDYSFLNPTLNQYYEVTGGPATLQPAATVGAIPSRNGATSGLAVWLDAADTSTIVHSDGQVRQWQDKSGNRNHLSQTKEALQPVYSKSGLNGQPSLSFERDVLVSQGSRLAYDQHLILVVAKARQTSSDILGSGGTGAGDILLMNHQNKYRGHFWSGGSLTVMDSKKPAATTAIVYCQHSDGKTLQIRRNGSLDVNAPLTKTPAGTLRQLIVGSRHSAGGSFIGEVAEVIVFLGVVSADELQRAEGYLAHKWGIAKELPSDHPCKSAPPTNVWFMRAATETVAQREQSKLSTSATGQVADSQRPPNIPPIGGTQVGSGFGLTDMRASGRGGVLGMGAILIRNSRTRRTSPVNRGVWVVENLLGRHLPSPPADVPPIPDRVEEGLSVREQLVKHREVKACASCHARIDPFGFAFEAFDAAGRLRPKEFLDKIEYEKTSDGVLLDGVESLRMYITQRSELLHRNLIRRMLGYALNRPVAVSDTPLIVRTLEDLPKNEYRLSNVVEHIVFSRQFRFHRPATEREFVRSD
ncbi:MAG: hypothetical protein ACI9G1_003428 [Pirellulaceae bacterium]|jgi:hypothetical protein